MAEDQQPGARHARAAEKAADAAQGVRRSARQLERSAGAVKSSADRSTELAADLLDIAALAGMAKRSNPHRGMAKAGLAFVLGVTALDFFTAVRMSTVKRNCE